MTIFFGFSLKIAVNPPSYFRLFDSIILLTALYAVTVATIMFLTPIIYHVCSHHQLDVQRFLCANQTIFVLIGIICVMVSIYLILGLVLNSTSLSVQVAYSLPSLPFVFICIDI